MRKTVFLAMLLLCGGSVLADDIESVAAKLAARAPDALQTALALTRAEPKNARAHQLLARAQMQGGELDAAVKSAERAARLDRNDAAIQVTLGEAYGSNIGNVGALSKMSYAGRMRDAFARAVELDPDHLGARAGLLQYFLQAPAIAGGSVAKAREQAEEIARRNPARGHVAHGQILEHDGEREAAIEAYRKALRADPEVRDAYYRLAYAQQRAEDWAAAKATLMDLLARHADEHGAWYQIGRNAALSGHDPEAGVDALERYVALTDEARSPGLQHVRFRLGNIHEKVGRMDAAAAAYREALAIDPDLAEAREALKRVE